MDPLVKRDSRSASFGTKVAPYLWRADLRFMNSVTGSGNVAKCSNVLLDNCTTTTVLVYIYDLLQRKGLAYSQNTGQRLVRNAEILFWCN